MKHWPFFWVLAITFIGVIIVSVTYIVFSKNPLTPACDRLFTEFMMTKDPLVVDRNGWLMYYLHCRITDRYKDTLS